jgi:hypothetical protein
MLSSFQPSVATAILWPMIPLPKPRGFLDYGLFAMILTGLLLLLFWFQASDPVGWADAGLAFAAAVVFVLAVVLVRRREKAKWIAQPTRFAHLVLVLGTFLLMFGAIYADAYVLHRRDITSSRLRHDVVFAAFLAVGMFWSLRRQLPARPTVG